MVNLEISRLPSHLLLTSVNPICPFIPLVKLRLHYNTMTNRFSFFFQRPLLLLFHVFLMFFFFLLLLCCRTSESSQPVQQSSAAKEKAQEPHGLHKSADFRAGEAISLPEVPEPRGSGRDRRLPRAQQCPGDHVVPEQASEAQTRHGGAQEGRAVRQSTSGGPASQNLPRERTGHGNSEKKAPTQFPRREILTFIKTVKKEEFFHV